MLLALFLLLSGFALACTDEQLCETSGVTECVVDAYGNSTHRACVYGVWAVTKCDLHQTCLADGCFEQAEICKDTLDNCFDDQTLDVCVKGERIKRQACGEGEVCLKDKCVDALCNNGRLDLGEDAVDCGGSCEACVECWTDATCVRGKFCDSASGYLCSKRCTSDTHCANYERWDGYYCRGDGRCSPKVFETVWELTAEDPTVVLPFDLNYSKPVCDFQVLWGDEADDTDMATLARVTDCTDIKNRTHKYAKEGKYHVKIIGTYDGWGAFNTINFAIDDGIEIPAIGGPKLREVVSFGPVGLSLAAFSGSTMLSKMPVKDIPDASKFRDFRDAFYKASRFNAPIGHWDTSKVVYMSSMFFEASVFNQPLNRWNTEQVLSMNNMFSRASAFNQPIDLWKLSSIEDMAYMFEEASSFDQDLTDWRFPAGTHLMNIFQNSGMSKDKLCMLKAQGDEWLKQWTELGKTVVCDD